MSWEQAAAAALARLAEPHLAKKKATVIALVDARLTGVSEETVWRRPDTCSRTIYHNKWKKEPVFASVLADVTKLAQEWRDGRATRALAEAAERLALASPLAVGKLIQKLNSQDEKIVLRAALGILDRAGMETAAKAQVGLGGIDDLLSDDEQRALEKALQEQAAQR